LADRFSISGYTTAYVGGGTPTALPLFLLSRLLKGIAELGGNRGFREWTVEANPESLTSDTLSLFADLGVDRISLGIQSREAAALAAVERITKPAQIYRALELVSTEWKGGFSADLIAGLPGQTPKGLQSDIEDVVSAGADHLSIYELTLEEGTPLAFNVRRGSVQLPKEALAEDLWEAAKEGCASAGLARYEVSNWARPGSECLHNMQYWRSGAWIGAGPSAVSSFPLQGGGSLRIEEGRDHEAYIRNSGSLAREEKIPPVTAAFETIMMAFRTRDGIDEQAFQERFGVALEELLGETLKKWGILLLRGVRGPAPSDRLLDILNRFLLDCMEELERTAAGRPEFLGGST